MSLSLTEAAAAQVRERLQARGRGVGIRVGVRHVESTGMAYLLAFADMAGDEDVVFESQGVAILTDMQSLPFLRDTVIDFQHTDAGSGFSICAEHACGSCNCGGAEVV